MYCKDLRCDEGCGTLGVNWVFAWLFHRHLKGNKAQSAQVIQDYTVWNDRVFFMELGICSFQNLYVCVQLVFYSRRFDYFYFTGWMNMWGDRYRNKGWVDGIPPPSIQNLFNVDLKLANVWKIKSIKNVMICFVKRLMAFSPHCKNWDLYDLIDLLHLILPSQCLRVTTVLPGYSFILS